MTQPQGQKQSGAGGDSGINKVAFNSLYTQPLSTSPVPPALASSLSSMPELYCPAPCSRTCDLCHTSHLFSPSSSFLSAQYLIPVIFPLKEAPPFKVSKNEASSMAVSILSVLQTSSLNIWSTLDSGLVLYFSVSHKTMNAQDQRIPLHPYKGISDMSI